MGSIAPSEAAPALVDKLRKSLTNSEVLVPGDEGYAQSIVRWSDAWEKKAVRIFVSLQNDRIAINHWANAL